VDFRVRAGGRGHAPRIDAAEDNTEIAIEDVRKRHLSGLTRCCDDRVIEPLISHADVATIMRLLGDIQDDVRQILRVLEEDDGEEEEGPEDSG
jgi:hypothetical protein